MLILAALLFSSCDEIFDLLFGGGSAPTQIGHNYGRLPNTTWELLDADFFMIYEQKLDFGNGTYRFEHMAYLFGLPITGSETGTYTVSGDIVTFTSNNAETVLGSYSGSSSGSKQIRGSLIGNTLTVGEVTLRRR